MDTDKIEREVMEQAKKVGSLLSRLLLRTLKPFIPFIIVAFIIFSVLVMLIAAVYSAMPQTGALAGVTQTNPEIDDKARKEYQKLCDKYNVKDTWLINQTPCEPGGPKHESSPDNPFYPGRGIRKIGVLADPYGSDKALVLKWGQVHAASLYRAYNFGQDKITNQEDVAKDLRPFFYYKQSYVYVTSSNEDGESETEKYIQYLLVEAYTIEGHYQYHYEWVTRTHGSGKDRITITKEELKSSQQILSNKWQRLEDWIVEEYKLEKNDEVPLARTAVWEAGQAYNEQKEWLEWLLNNMDIANYLSTAMVPPELMPHFREAEEKYGIPWWFLAAVAFKESSFNPKAENPGTRCYGLMQLTPSNWEHYSRLLGFDPVLDRDNPRAQILCGAYMLKELGLENVNWKGEWKESTLGVLTFYGGFRGYKAEERCWREYAGPIWEMAEIFKKTEDITWPVPGCYHISSSFGLRFHSILRKCKDHSGIDIAAPAGKTVVSVSSGVVTFAGWKGGYGNAVEVRDGRHRYIYAHLSSIAVREGQSVHPNTKLGEVGSTGISSGPHLHFGVWDLQKEGWIDPMLVLQGRRGGD